MPDYCQIRNSLVSKSVTILECVSVDFESINQSINQSNFDLVYPLKWGWSDLPHSNSNLFNSYSPSRSIQGILLLQTNTLALFLHLCLPCLFWSSSLPLSLHFKLQCFSQNMCCSSK